MDEAHARGIDHVGVVVRDLDAAAETYKRLLGASELAREELEEHGVAVVALRLPGGIVELLSPTRSGTGVARFLDGRGEGLHHVAYRVESVARELERLRQEGVRLVDEQPRRGLGGRAVAFVHPQGASGVLTELVEPWEDHP
ncbi:MAG: methylmalonyl-CoA epimerase [Chloroflexota bacterium]|nr:methylmalonyl-CoA epimerase [Chloroflexota bacterium]